MFSTALKNRCSRLKVEVMTEYNPLSFRIEMINFDDSTNAIPKLKSLKLVFLSQDL